MERPSLEHYRRVLREQGIELPEDELRELRDQVGRFAASSSSCTTSNDLRSRDPTA